MSQVMEPTDRSAIEAAEEEALLLEALIRENQIAADQEASEAYLLNMSVDEYKRHLADLCQDAADIGTDGPF